MKIQNITISTLLTIVNEIKKTSPDALLRDPFGDQPVTTWEQQVRMVMSDQRFKDNPDYRPEEDIFNVRAWINGNEIFSGETGEKIYTIVNSR